jgi:hypothetical protein
VTFAGNCEKPDDQRPDDCRFEQDGMPGLERHQGSRRHKATPAVEHACSRSQYALVLPVRIRLKADFLGAACESAPPLHADLLVIVDP